MQVVRHGGVIEEPNFTKFRGSIMQSGMKFGFNNSVTFILLIKII